MTLQKWKEFNKAMEPHKRDLYIWLISIIACAILTDLQETYNINLNYTITIFASIFYYISIFASIWFVSTLITEILIKRKQKKNAKTTQQIKTENKQ